MKLEIKNLSKSYGKKLVLQDVCLSAQTGSCIGILGENGCGKSTLLSILAGITQPDGGQVLCDGQDVLKNSKLRKSHIGYVPQGTPLAEELSARDNLLLWYSRKQLEQSLQDGVLKMLGIDSFCSTQVSKLSGGMKKRLSIGCALAQQQRILALDEPMAALDLSCKQKIAAYLQSYKQSGGIVLLVTHDVFELSLCDMLYILKDGVLTPYCYDGDFDALVKHL